ncbi:MAG: DUF4290 domain-containing protein [Saprospiraceae bacterium]
MQYNSNQEKLIFPEYGRNVQSMIRVVRNEADAKKRQAMSNAIVNLMAHLSPGLKNGVDIRPRIWKHFFAIAEYKIDVLSNEGIKYEEEEKRIKPTVIDYPPNNESFRHYGNHVRKLIEKAIQMEDGPKKSYMVSLIGSYMKMAYKTWNKDHYVSDEGIIKDLKILSKGKLNIEDETSLDVLARRGKGGNLQPSSSESRPVKHNKFRGRSNNNNNNRRFNDRNRNNRRR